MIEQNLDLEISYRSKRLAWRLVFLLFVIVVDLTITLPHFLKGSFGFLDLFNMVYFPSAIFLFVWTMVNFLRQSPVLYVDAKGLRFLDPLYGFEIFWDEVGEVKQRRIFGKLHLTFVMEREEKYLQKLGRLQRYQAGVSQLLFGGAAKLFYSPLNMPESEFIAVVKAHFENSKAEKLRPQRAWWFNDERSPSS